MSSPASGKTNKLSGDFSRALPHLQLDAEATTALGGCADALEALARLEQAGFLIEATRLVAHAMPAREGVWWACACSRHTAPSGANPAAETTVRDAAEEWGRRPTDRHRAAARGEEAGGDDGLGQSGGLGCRRRLLERRFDGPAGSPESAATAAFHRAR